MRSRCGPVSGSSTCSRAANAFCSACQVSVSLVIVAAERPLVEPRNCPSAGPEVLRREPVQVQQRQHLLDLRGLARPRRQDRRREPLPLAGFRVNPLVVHPRRMHLDRARGGGHLARLVIAVAHHQPMPVLVAFVGELGAVGWRQLRAIMRLQFPISPKDGADAC
jgi:hypothetical protein